MIAKQKSPKGRSVRVTFKLPVDRAMNSAFVVGSFNDWNPERHPMKLDNTKRYWTRNISFKPGEIVEFRYLVDGSEWYNDEQADAFVATPFFSENGVLEL